MSLLWLVLLALPALVGCGTQFADPVLEESPKPICPPSYVLDFDGVSALGTITRLIQDDFTIEAWIRTPSSPTGPTFSSGSAIVFADVTTPKQGDFATATLNDRFVFSTGGPDTGATSTSVVTTNHWVHVAATRTRVSGVMLLFVNGELEGSAVGNDHSLLQSPNITFGGRPGRNFYLGSMTDIRLWQIVRTQSDIVANMHRRLSGSEAGLVGYYRLDDHADALARDSSAKGNDAVLSGGFSWLLSDVPLCDP